MEYLVYSTGTFKKIYSSLDGNEKQWINKVKGNFENSPGITGKILKYRWFREKRYNDKRPYYLIDEEKKRILFVSFASKKDQQKIIDFITLNMKELLNYLKSLN